MTVHCPHCSTGYLLPDHLVGARGARVRCPNCQGAFAVPAGEVRSVISEAFRKITSGDESEHAGHDAAGAAATAADVTPAPAETPDAIAAEILEALVGKLGEALVDARRRGQVLSRHGPAIMDAFAEYRGRAGENAPRGPFHVALKERCGVSLTAPGEVRGHALGG